MGQKRSRATSRAWSLLRIALLWARKGGILKCRLMAELRHVPKHIKALHRHSSSRGRRIDSAAFYGERELSFDDTPILRLGMSRPCSLRFKLPNIPCIKPSVADFDYDFGHENEIYGAEIEGESSRSEYCNYNLGEEEEEEEEEECREEGIDEKADEFIARFYQQMKMQRQVSYIEYQEMLSRSTS